MTQVQLKRRFLLLGILGGSSIFGIPLVVAAENGSSAIGSFMTAAEKFGIFAAVNAALVGCMIYFLYRIVTYATGRLEAVVDDNTLCFHRFARAMASRPCISDSDVDRIIEPDDDDESSGDAVVQRVRERRKQRKDRGI
jgi:hypothetical protein